MYFRMTYDSILFFVIELKRMATIPCRAVKTRGFVSNSFIESLRLVSLEEKAERHKACLMLAQWCSRRAPLSPKVESRAQSYIYRNKAGA